MHAYSYLLFLKQVPTAVINEAQLTPKRCQAPIGVISTQKQAPLAATRQHPVWLPQILVFKDLLSEALHISAMNRKL